MPLGRRGDIQMTVILTGVPLWDQTKDREGNKSNRCWYWSAVMVANYFEAGPRQGIPSKLPGNTAIHVPEFITLAQNEHLVPVPCKTMWTCGAISHVLSASGPIWSAGHWPDSNSGHVVVVTGAGQGTVYYNDPWGGIAKTGTIEWFNKKLSKSIKGCMMVRRASSVTPRPKKGWGLAPTSIKAA